MYILFTYFTYLLKLGDFFFFLNKSNNFSDAEDFVWEKCSKKKKIQRIKPLS